MEYAPIVITACQRFDKFKECVQSLQNCKCAEESVLFVALDFPIEEKYVQDYSQIKDYIYNDITGFKKVISVVREKNVGYIRNMQDIFDRVFGEYDRLIYTEDDNIFSSEFLVFQNECLEYFKDDDRISCICGFTIYDILDESSVHLEPGFPFWGLGIWRHRWRQINEYLSTDSFNKIAMSIKKQFCIWQASPRNYNKFIGYVCSKNVVAHDSAYACIAGALGMRRISPNHPMVKNMGMEGYGVAHAWNKNSEEVNQLNSIAIYDYGRFELIVDKSELFSRKNINRFHREKGFFYIKPTAEIRAILKGIVYYIRHRLLRDNAVNE